MPARLVPLTPGVAPPIALHRPVVLVGRHPECDVRIDLPQISRRHCCLAQAYDRILIRDLGSRNGVRVNGAVVEEAPLAAGDEVAIGQLLYRLDLVIAPPEPAAIVRPTVKPAGAPGAGTSPTAAPPPARPMTYPIQSGSASFPDISAEGGDEDVVPLDDIDELN